MGSRQVSSAFLLKSGLEAAEAAAKVLQKYFRKKFKIETKDQAGLVTTADLEAEEKVIRILKKKTPNFGFLAEESGKSKSTSASEGRWIIDPLDGTTNFAHGFPVFCVSIAAEVAGECVAGIIYHPITGEIFTAEKGKGAFLNKKKIQVSKKRELSKSLLSTGFSYKKESHLADEMETFLKLMDKSHAIRRPGSAALDLAYTAAGVFDAYWERGLSPWDVAAGALMIKEAGGIVTDFRGNPYRIEEPAIVAANPSLHPQVLALI